MTVYNNFEEVAKEISEKTPPIIYKYRDWEKDFHKTIITKQELYFAQPHTLNDPYDVRPPYNFVVPDLDLEAARKRIREAGKSIRPDLTDEELEQEVEIRLQSIIQDPVSYFKKNRMDHVLDSSRYDTIGVLSFCSAFDNEPMWAHYGNNHNGFAIGFNTVKLARALNCTVGLVDYNDTPLDYHIMGDNSGLLEKELFRKSTKWQSEQELRFLTVGVGLYRNRVNTFPADTVEEIVFGLNTSKETQDQIIAASNQTLPGVSFYKLVVKADAFGFDKEKLQ
ncbi:MAG: DUF2971 domain-containing protein [Bacteroidetes bacterium]|nr:DUF2971 domain-containing protein [Bacteroidota bacterium]